MASILVTGDDFVPLVAFQKKKGGGIVAWVAQSVEHPTLAQVMISWFVSSGPKMGSVLTAQSLEPASDAVSPSLSLPLPRSCSVSQKWINIKKKIGGWGA